MDWMTSDPHFSRLLAENLDAIIGSEDTIHTRRVLDDVCDDILEVKGPVTKPIRSGSTAEGFRMRGSDFDIMYSVQNIHVTQDLADLRDREATLFLRSDGARKGYARVLCLTPESMPNEIRQAFSYMEDGYYTLSSDSFIEQFKSKQMGNERHGPCIRGCNRFGTEVDNSICLTLKFWPVEADEWPTRIRSFNWPPSETLGKIKHKGCHLMPIGSRYIDSLEEKHPLEWRFSFSVAEKELVYSFNHTQFLIYGLLKLWLKEVLDDQYGDEHCLCSYFLKTLLFWAIEESPKDIWIRDRFLYCLQVCFKRLRQWIADGNIPNYFIPDNNMIAGKLSRDKTEQLSAILSAQYNEGWRCFLQCRSLSQLREGIETGIRYGMDPRVACQHIRTKDRSQSHDEYLLDHIFFMEVISSERKDQTLEIERGILQNITEILHKENLDQTATDVVGMMLRRIAGNIGLHLCHNSMLSNKSNEEKDSIIYESVKFLKISCKGDISRGNLSLATMYYLLGNLEKSLNYIQTFHKLYGPCVLHLSRRQTEMRMAESTMYEKVFCGRSFPREYKASQAAAYDFEARKCAPILPNDLRLEVEMVPDESFILCFDPQEYSYFLKFLCCNESKMRRRNSYDETEHWRREEAESLDAMVALNSGYESKQDNYLLQLMIGISFQKLDKFNDAIRMFVAAYSKKKTLVLMQSYAGENESVDSPLLYTAMLLRLFL